MSVHRFRRSSALSAGKFSPLATACSFICQRTTLNRNLFRLKFLRTLNIFRFTTFPGLITCTIHIIKHSFNRLYFHQASAIIIKDFIRIEKILQFVSSLKLAFIECKRV